MGERSPVVRIAAVATLMTTAFVLAAAFVLVARAGGDPEALRQSGGEQEKAKKYAAIARVHSFPPVSLCRRPAESSVFALAAR